MSLLGKKETNWQLSAFAMYRSSTTTPKTTNIFTGATSFAVHVSGPQWQEESTKSGRARGEPWPVIGHTQASTANTW